MRKGDATRARILDEAARQASLRGLAIVSLSDVAEAIGISKSGVFKHFQSKEAMQQAVLEATAERVIAFVWRPARDVPRGRERLDFIFRRMLDWEEFECGDYGCLVQSSTVEFDDQPGPIREMLHATQAKVMQAVMREIGKLHEPALDPETVAQAAFEFRCLIAGFGSVRRTLAPGEARRRALTAYEQLMHRLSERSRTFGADQPG
jgi:AcrR family transcriptional regulator